MPDVRPDVSLVVALLDEEGTIAELVKRSCAALEQHGTTFEILLIDDGSRDRTVEIVRQLEASDQRVHVYELSRNFGQNAALACGLFAARGDVIVTMDGDLQNPPEEVPTLLRALPGPGWVITGRRGERYEQFLRRLGSRAIHWLARWLTGARIEDFGGNFRAYHRDVIEAMRQVWAAGKPLLPLALWLGYPVREVTVAHQPRQVGASHYSLIRLFRINLDLILSFTTLPLTLLGIAGVLILGLSVVLFLISALAEPTPWLRVAVALTLGIIGTVLFSAGVLGQYLAKIYWLAAGKGPAFIIRQGPK
jgi:undecaprenyl-phosphate 4-deoxy-4-formamido-L-arabinose transferase